MKKRTSRLLSILLTLVMLLGLVPALSLTASAYSGSGTATNPYVATTYDEVRTLVADAPTDGTTRYIKLGANVVSSSNTDNNDIKLGKDNRQRVVLDLAGHSITRSETTSDCDVICVSAGYLTIQDSVGSGRVVEDIKVASAKTIPNTLYVFGSGHLTIESGTFESKNGCAIEGRGVSTVIDGGTFTSSNPYFNEIRFKLNSSSVDNDEETLLDGPQAMSRSRSGASRPMPGGARPGAVRPVPGGARPGAVRPAPGGARPMPGRAPMGGGMMGGGMMGGGRTSNADEVRASVEYQQYEQMGQEIRDALLQVRQEARDTAAAANAPKTAVTCPYCGATTTPDASGCCEFCGGAISG